MTKMENKYTLYETDAFCAFVPQKPHIDRRDGGHIVIMSKTPGCYSLIELPDELAKELICLAKCCGKAITDVLSKDGIDIGIVNYQINGNWSVNQPKRDSLHLHVYGRSKKSVHQVYGEALHFPNPHTGFYDEFESLTQTEAEDITAYILKDYSCGEK